MAVKKSYDVHVKISFHTFAQIDADSEEEAAKEAKDLFKHPGVVRWLVNDLTDSVENGDQEVEISEIVDLT